jgi:pyruvate-ferredoxin/flavodoxin oxidoreductase
MAVSVRQRRAKLAETVKAFIACDCSTEEAKAAGAEWLEVMNDGKLSGKAGKKLLAAIEGIDSPAAKEIKASADMLEKKSVWIFGGDGWAYDIGFGGLDHAIASGEDINIFVFDTEVYSNTGGQASKATPTGSVAQFAASGKNTKKKDLAQIAMSYGYVYTAQVALGADYAQTVKAIAEAEAYHGPSLIIGYAPCINHGIKKGLATAMEETKLAVQSGYWFNFRFNPDAEQPFKLDSKEPTLSYRDFIMTETRYNSLVRAFPERAEELFAAAEKQAKEKYRKLTNMSKLYE